MTIKCPKCSASIPATPDELGMVTCPQCGARLRSKQPVKVTVQGGAPTSLPRIDPAMAAPADVDSVLSRIDSALSPDMTVRPGALPKVAPPSAAPAAASGVSLETVLAEIRALRRTQEEILALVRARPVHGAAGEAASFADADEGVQVPAPAWAKPRGRRSVLVIDDDQQACQEAALALQAVATVKTASDGNSAVAAIALERPNVIVLELDLGGAMPGHDLVNMIKATMEWVDIPIVLYTRRPMGDLKEERQVHGVDEIVPKAQGSAAALAAKVGALLARG